MGVAPPQSSVADLRRAAVAYVRTRRVTSGAVAMTATVVPRGGLRTTRAVGVAVARVAHLRSSAASAAGHTVHRRAARAARITRVAPGARHAVTVAAGTPRRTAVRGRTSQTGQQQNDHYKFRHRSPPRATGAQGSRASPCLTVQLQRIRPAARRSASRAGASVCRYLGQHLPRTDARTVASRSAFGARR